MAAPARKGPRNPAATGSKSGDTSHLYDGKTVRAAAPSRKTLAGRVG